MNLRLARNELGQDTPETQGIFREGRAQPVLAGRGGVALVKDQVDDFQHGRQTNGKIGTAGDLKGDARLAEGPLGPDNALGHRGLRNEESACDFLRCQTSEQTKRESNARFRRENWMTGDEHETQQIVADVIVNRGVEIRHGHLLLRR